MMLVGRPGLGKTPPLGFIYKPINEYDDLLHEKYNEEYDEYERAMSAVKHGTEFHRLPMLFRADYADEYSSSPQE